MTTRTLLSLAMAVLALLTGISAIGASNQRMRVGYVALALFLAAIAAWAFRVRHHG